MPVPDVHSESVRVLLAKLRLIPDSARRFEVDRAAAWRWWRVPADLLDGLVTHGLPTDSRGRFEATDLTNIATELSTSAAARAARRFWATGMSRDAGGTPVDYEIRYHVRCPAPGHAPSCRFRSLLPGGAVREMSAPADGTPVVAATARVTIDPTWPELPARFRDLIEVTRGIDFIRLPLALRTDLDFIRSARLSDCAGAARLLVAEGQRRDLPVRHASGLMLVLPFSAPHEWAEVRVGERWVPIDPILVNAMLGWGVLDPERWDAYRSPGAILCRISDARVHLTEHDGVPVAATFATGRSATGLREVARDDTPQGAR